MHEARSVEEGVDFADQLLDIERDLDRLLDVACIRAGYGSFGDAGRAVQALPHLREMRLQQRLKYLWIHGGEPFRHHTRSASR